MAANNQIGFIDIESIPEIEPAPGCKLRTPYGENLMLSQVTAGEVWTSG